MKRKILFTLMILFSGILHSQENNNFKIEETRTIIGEDTCQIFFNLDSQEEVQIYLYLVIGKEPANKYELKKVSGAIGKVAGGKEKKIIWDRKSENLKEIILGSEIKFEIRAEVITSKSEKEEKSFLSKNIYWIGGGALLAGGIITYLLLNKSSSETLPDPVGFSFPK